MPTIGLSKPPQQDVVAPLSVGERLPDPKLLSDLIDGDTRPYVMVAFLRHPGCPFAEATVRNLRTEADHFDQVSVVLVTHGDHAVTERWLGDIGGLGKLHWYHDANREMYGRWGLGYSGIKHMFGWSVFRSISALRKQGITNRDASGTRWQQAGAFLINPKQEVVWLQSPETADRLPSIDTAMATMSADN